MGRETTGDAKMSFTQARYTWVHFQALVPKYSIHIAALYTSTFKNKMGIYAPK